MHKGYENTDRLFQSSYFSRGFNGPWCQLQEVAILSLSRFQKLGHLYHPLIHPFSSQFPSRGPKVHKSPTVLSYHTSHWHFCLYLDTFLLTPLYLSIIHPSRSSSSPLSCTKPSLRGLLQVHRGSLTLAFLLRFTARQRDLSTAVS